MTQEPGPTASGGDGKDIETGPVGVSSAASPTSVANGAARMPSSLSSLHHDSSSIINSNVNGNTSGRSSQNSVRIAPSSDFITHEVSNHADADDITPNNNMNADHATSELQNRIRQRRAQQRKQQRQSGRVKTSSMKSLSAAWPRLVARGLPYGQSPNEFTVKNNNRNRGVYQLYLLNWFHVLLRWQIYFSLPLLLASWTTCILIFAGVYIAVDERNKDIDCGLGDPGVPITWGAAFAFSLETCTTVGYGLPGSTNAFFEANCPSVQLAIYAQMTWSMMFNAFIFAFFFVALSKSESRSSQVVFSDRMVIHTESQDNRIYAKVRVFDLDSSHGVVEAHIRIYAFTKDFKLEPLRVNYPDDDMGATLVPSLPIRVIHQIDHHSVLSPRRRMPFVADARGLLCRSADSEACNREEIICPICGESYGTYDRLRAHVAYTAKTEEDYDVNFPRHLSHRHLRIPEIRQLTLNEVKQHIESNISEVVVVVEGIDPQASGTFQALQSYKYDDIVWEGKFRKCLSVDNDKFTVNMEKLHMIDVPDHHKHLNEVVVEEESNYLGTKEGDSFPIGMITTESPGAAAAMAAMASERDGSSKRK